MLGTIGRAYVTLMPVILGGAANMVFTKTRLYRQFQVPMDGTRTLADGKRMFGDNKTWIGFGGMIFFCALFQVLWGGACRLLFPEQNLLYIQNLNHWSFNLLVGFLFGFAYMICELPNSLVKRRLDIREGKTGSGWLGILFFVIDQIDSLLGVMLVLALFYPLAMWEYWLFIAVGAFTHVGVNAILLGLRIRKNI